MKKYNLIMSVLLFAGATLASCDPYTDEKPGGTATEKVAGTWTVTFEQSVDEYFALNRAEEEAGSLTEAFALDYSLSDSLKELAKGDTKKSIMLLAQKTLEEVVDSTLSSQAELNADTIAVVNATLSIFDEVWVIMETIYGEEDSLSHEVVFDSIYNVLYDKQYNELYTKLFKEISYEIYDSLYLADFDSLSSDSILLSQIYDSLMISEYDAIYEKIEVAKIDSVVEDYFNTEYIRLSMQYLDELGVANMTPDELNQLDWADLYGAGKVSILSSNTSANVSKEMWLIDEDFWVTQIRCDVNCDERTFSAKEQEVYEGCQMTVIGGKILLGAATTPRGVPADSIVAYVKYSDDKNGFTYMKMSGHRYTGYTQDK